MERQGTLLKFYPFVPSTLQSFLNEVSGSYLICIEEQTVYHCFLFYLDIQLSLWWKAKGEKWVSKKKEAY